MLIQVMGENQKVVGSECGVRGSPGMKWNGGGIQTGGSKWAKKMVVLRAKIRGM